MYKFQVMSQTEAEEIAYGWKYKGEYAFYDVIADKGDCDELVDETARNNYFSVFDEATFCGYFSYTYNTASRVIEIGLGMRPDYTGKGYGKQFVTEGIKFAKTIFPFAKIKISVASFNLRAITLYENLGFKKIREFEQKTNGAEYPFIELELEI